MIILSLSGTSSADKPHIYVSKMSTSAETSKLILSLKDQEDQKDVMKCVKLLIAKGCSINDIMKVAIDENRIEFVDSIIIKDDQIWNEVL